MIVDPHQPLAAFLKPTYQIKYVQKNMYVILPDTCDNLVMNTFEID